jgi:hypothetical protein
MLEESIVEPVASEPVVNEPAVEDVVVEEPLVEKVVLEEPLVEKVVVEEPVVEPVVEKVVVVEPVVNDIIVNTLIELVKKSLDEDKKLYIALTPEVISVINNIISLAPNTLTDIEKAILEVIKDGNIDSKDIPNLIIIVQKLYQVVYSLKSMKLDYKKRADIAGSVLKYVVNILVVERIIKIDEDKQTEFYLQVNALIDSCVGLLSFPESIKTKGCLKKLFG